MDSESIANKILSLLTLILFHLVIIKKYNVLKKRLDLILVQKKNS